MWPGSSLETRRERSSFTTNHLRQRVSRGHCWYGYTCRRSQPRERCGGAHIRGDHQVPGALRARAARLNVGACSVVSDHVVSACDEPSGWVHEAHSTQASTSTSRFAHTRLGEKWESFCPRCAGWVYQELLAPRQQLRLPRRNRQSCAASSQRPACSTVRRYVPYYIAYGYSIALFSICSILRPAYGTRGVARHRAPAAASLHTTYRLARCR